MRLQLRKPTQALNKAYAKQSVAQERIYIFRQALTRLFGKVDETESEEYQKNIVTTFLNESFYGPTGPLGYFEISTHDRVDLVIHTGLTDQALPGVLIKAKKVFAGEMMTTLKNNVKSLHELILYYFEEHEQHNTTALRHLIITDVYNWFIFDETDFRHFFHNNAKLRKAYQIKRQQNKDKTFFYTETARILREMDDEVPVTCLNLREIATLARSENPEDLQQLLPVYKLLSPEHLLKLPFANDANTLNRSFYNELLHLAGLHETAADGVLMIRRLPEEKRLVGSLLENTINVLRAEKALAEPLARNPHNRANYSDEEHSDAADNQLFDVALGLCITWLNRILFLKLLESQLLRYNDKTPQNLREVEFLTPRHIREFDELGELFFEVVAVPEANRPAAIVNRYGAVPYLNCSLFELTDLERQTITIKALNGQLDLPLFEQTALKNAQRQLQTGKLPALQYLLAFLNSFDFSSEGPAEIQIDNKPLMTATMLGPIFEKLNGYTDGAFFTPGFVPMYMVRDLIRRAALARFNDHFGWQCSNLTALRDQLDGIEFAEANAVMNSLRILDPAVGSGHFLVSALNEIIALKAELGILTDRKGYQLRYYDIRVVNDELVITTEDGELFQYRVGGKSRKGRQDFSSTSSFSSLTSSESQRVQEAIFHEKQTIIENCLFGVDLNPIAISICRLRLWIELLKNVYYAKEDGGARGERSAVAEPIGKRSLLQAFPNLDTNVKVGNSLVSRFGLGFRIDSLRNQVVRERLLRMFDQYCLDAISYRECWDKAKKEKIRERISQFQTLVHQVAMIDQKEYAEIKQLEIKLAESASTFDFFNQDDRLQLLQDELATKKSLFAEKQHVYRQATEWRFAFPDVLDESGSYVGFDVIVSNPPYFRQEEMGEYKALFSKAFPNMYAGNAEMYMLFIELGMNLLRPGGQLGYIVPNKWMRAGYGANLRKWLKTVAVEQITDFGDLPVFTEAEPGFCILTLRRADATDSIRAAHVDTLKFDESGLLGYVRNHTFTVPVASLQDSAWVLSDTTVQNLLTKLKQTGQPLGSYVNNKIYTGIRTGLNEAFVVDKKTRDKLIAEDPRSAEVLKPFLASRDIKRYQCTEATKFLLLFERGITTKQRGDLEPEEWLSQTYPAVYGWLKPFEARAKARAEKGILWWELRDCDYYAAFGEPHLITPSTSKQPLFGWADAGVYAADKTTVVGTSDNYVLAILNAKVARFFMSFQWPVKKNGDVEYKPVSIAHIPIPPVTPEQKAPIVTLVEQILAAKANDLLSDTSGLETEIDQLVYGLFGLSDEEITVIEGYSPDK